MPNWTLNDIPPQTEKLAVVTGATGGLGFETALGLAQAGAEVVLAGRNREKGRIALERIMRALPSAKADFQMLDLASLVSVRAFAEKMIVRGKPLALLINNAGVMDLPARWLTKDGFEMQFGTNHLSHFAPDRLTAAAPEKRTLGPGRERE
jgi:NAD(P)-dependent dehydrogenase (short-subunit alcohol dehydrogenase family)